MDSSLYSQSKALWHFDRMDDLRNGRQPVPVHVQLILSDLCNQDCSFCSYRMSGGLSTELFSTHTHNPNRQIEREKAMEIIRDCAEIGVKAIQFTGGGEPTVHKHHGELITYAQALGLETSLVTNGIKLDPNADFIKDLKWIRVSVDAGWPATYAETRRVKLSHWDKVWQNINLLAQTNATLGVGFVVTRHNFTEIAECARLAKRAGADNLRVGAVFSEQGIHFYDGVLEQVIENIEIAKLESTKDFDVIDLFGRRLNDLESGNPEHPDCHYQFFTAYIGADLNVYRCCNTAYTKKGLVGSLKDARFKDLALNYLPFDARSCHFCQFRGQNKAINASLEPPTHGNFT